VQKSIRIKNKQPFFIYCIAGHFLILAFY